MTARSDSEQGVRHTDGWLQGITPRSPAHFYRDGISLCHRWSSTVYDSPAEPGRKRCDYCAELYDREGRG